MSIFAFFILLAIMFESSQCVITGRFLAAAVAKICSNALRLSTNIFPVEAPINSLTPGMVCSLSSFTVSALQFVAPKKNE